MDQFKLEFLEQRRLLDGQVEVGGFVGPDLGGDVPTDVYTYLEVTPTADYVAKESKSFEGSLGRFQGDLSADAYKATIDWGDGNSSDGTVVKNEDGSYGIVGAHDYADAGQYGVSVQVDGTDGSTGYSYETALIGADRLTVLGSPSLWGEPSAESQQQYLGSFFDKAGADESSYAITIDWGDGTTSAGTAVQGFGGAWDVYGDHAYAAEGNYDVSMKVTSGSDSVEAQGTAEIATYTYDATDIEPWVRGGVMYDMVASTTVDEAATLSPVASDPTGPVAITMAPSVKLSAAKPDYTDASVTKALAPVKSVFSNQLIGRQKSLFDDAASDALS